MAGDASTRSYARLIRDDGVVILMNSPRRPDGPAIYDGKSYSAAVHLAEDVKPFVAIANGLRERGFSAPAIHHADLEAGFLITEDFGSAGFIEGDPPRPIAERYQAATDMLAALHREPLPEILPLAPQLTYAIPAFDTDALLVEIGLMLEWYLPDRGAEPTDESARRIRRDVARSAEQARGGGENLGAAGLSFAQPDLARRAAGYRESRHHRLPGRRAGPRRLRSGVAVAGRADRRARAARACAADALHQGAARRPTRRSIRLVSPSSTPSCRRSGTPGCSAPLRGSTGATASRNICAISPGSGPISPVRWPIPRSRASGNGIPPTFLRRLPDLPTC